MSGRKSLERSWLVVAGVVLAVCAGCDPSSEGEHSKEDPSRKAAQPYEGGELVFEEAFDDDEPGQDWVRGTGEAGKGRWRVEEGWMVGNDIKNDPLWLKRSLPGEVRVEFDVQAMSPVGDIKFEAFGDGDKHETGYVFIFGGWKNSLDVIARLDEHGQDRKERPTRGVVPNTTYRMALERVGDELRWFVDGEHFMSYRDEKMLRGEGHDRFAFNVWSAPVRFDNVRVYDLTSAK